jgi:hypothetical protein
MFERFGAVKASPLATYRLLKSGDPILLFPGAHVGHEPEKIRNS